MAFSLTMDTPASLRESAARLRALAAAEQPGLARSLLELADLFEGQAGDMGCGPSGGDRGRLAFCNPRMSCEACLASRGAGRP